MTTGAVIFLGIFTIGMFLFWLIISYMLIEYFLGNHPFEDKEFKQKLAKIGDTNFIDNKMFETIKIEKRDNVEEPAFDMNDLYKKLKNNKDVRKNIYDYYKMLMQLEIDIDSGKIKMDDKFEEEKFGPNMYMYIVLGFLGTAMGFELANLSNVRAAMGNT